MRSLGLYIHIPFCQKKCNYCDFYSIGGCSSSEIDSYIDCLCEQIKREEADYQGYVVDTIFLGGGTPSLASPKSIDKLFSQIRSSLLVDKNAEISIEINPGTIDKEKLQAYKRNGINRISIGLQSTKDTDLKVLGRIHTYEEFLKTYKEIRGLGFENISVDLMYGLPNQKTEDFLKILEDVVDFAPEHISAYCLKIEENTPFGRIKDTLCLPSDDEEYEAYLALCRFLESKGYLQYEISNFAKEGYRSRHNLRYWLGEEYLGLGPGAHSFIDGKRFYYDSSLDGYMIKQEKHYEEDEGSLSKMDEYVMLRLRLSDGVNGNEFYTTFGTELTKAYPTIEKFIKSGHVLVNEDKYKLSTDGLFVSNYILTELFDN
ncbi:MAG: radical SAM family heme chaperone HemW [Clostridia bacterium]|nr:radical SAM family heme chaperone HemW [Clostridia bacterium]